MVAPKGSFAKTHLLSFLQCLKAGSVFWDDNKQLMVPPAAADTLQAHIEHGMFYEIFQYVAVRDDRAAMLALCQADNLDSAFALGETEMTLLRTIHASIAVCRPPVGTSQWDSIRDTAARSCGQRWEDRIWSQCSTSQR